MVEILKDKQQYVLDTLSNFFIIVFDCKKKIVYAQTYIYIFFLVFLLFSFIFQIVPEKKSNASISQNGSAAKRRITPVHKTKPTANSEANKKAREAREQARRQMIEERRRAMRSNIQNQDNSVKIFAPET